MLAHRNLSLPAHGMIELVAGIATMLAPVVLGFGPAGIVVAFALGALLVGMSLPLTTQGRLNPGGHRDIDSMFVIGAALAALALALAGERTAGFFIAALVVFQSGLHLATRYVSAG